MPILVVVEQLPPGMAISKAAGEALVVSVYVETRTTVGAIVGRDVVVLVHALYRTWACFAFPSGETCLPSTNACLPQKASLLHLCSGTCVNQLVLPAVSCPTPRCRWRYAKQCERSSARVHTDVAWMPDRVYRSAASLGRRAADAMV